MGSNEGRIHVYEPSPTQLDHTNQHLQVPEFSGANDNAPVPPSNYDDTSQKINHKQPANIGGGQLVSSVASPEVIECEDDAPVPISFRQTKASIEKTTTSRDSTNPPRSRGNHKIAPEVSITISVEETQASNSMNPSSQSSNDDISSLMSSNQSRDVINIADAHIAIAHPIKAYLHQDEPIYEASELDPSVKVSFYKSQRCCILTALTLLITGAIIAIGVVFSSKPTIEEYVVAQSPTMKPTTYRESLGIQDLIEKNVLRRNLTFNDIDAIDPRYLALDWILHEDRLQLTADSPNILQRYILAVLAFSFDIYSWNCGMVKDLDACNDTYYYGDDDYAVWLSGADECLWWGVYCNDDDNIEVLYFGENLTMMEDAGRFGAYIFVCQMQHLDSNNLIGTIPPEISGLKNLTALSLWTNW